MDEVCTDGRFDLIARLKRELVEATNIETSPEEMAVLDSILFRMWQMGWLDKIAAPRWVRCEEERPEDLRVVIIHKKWDGEITLGYSYPGFEEKKKLWMCLKTPYDQYEVPWVGAGHVDYWMPLPEPPKEEA